MPALSRFFPARSLRVPLLLLLLVLLPGPRARADGDLPGTIAAPRSPAELAGALAEFNVLARFPLPTLSTSELHRLAEGKPVKIREVSEDPDAPQRAIGLLLTSHHPAALWLSMRDPHFTAVEELVEVQLTPRGQWPAVWYQHLDLPRPISDRQWVVDVADTHALASASGGRCWEHAWTLTAGGPAIGAAAVAAGRIPGVDIARAADAIHTPTNHGAWLVIDLGGGETVLGYHVTSVIGGAIPDKLVADYTLFTLSKMLRGVADRTPEVVAHYDDAHAPIEGGDGLLIRPHAGR